MFKSQVLKLPKFRRTELKSEKLSKILILLSLKISIKLVYKENTIMAQIFDTYARIENLKFFFPNLEAYYPNTAEVESEIRNDGIIGKISSNIQLGGVR